MEQQLKENMTASALVDVLLTGIAAEKGKGIRWLDGCEDDKERERLRALLIYHLNNTHTPTEDPDSESEQRRDARAWLLSALGRVGEGDAVAEDILKRELNPEIERSRWCRYWALEGIAARGGNSADEFASVSVLDKDPLVQCLALAIQARAADPGALKRLRTEIDHQDEEHVWAALRALRVAMVLDNVILDKVLTIVRKGSYSDATYDAIIALGRVPAGTPEAEDAAEVLAGYVRRYRWPMYDSNRTNALISLGRLRSVLSVPLLVEELTGENPMLVLQAARALQASLGSRTACRRIIEAATEGTRPPQSYAEALRALDRGDVVDELEAALAAGPTQEGDVALVLLRELGGAEALDRLSAMRRSAEAFISAQSKADEEIRVSLDRSLAEARQGFKIVTGMDIAVFIAGFALLGIGIYLVFDAKEPLDKLIGGVTSSAGFIGILLKNWLVRTRDRIEPSVRRLVSLQAAFHGYLRQLRQVDQAYTQRVLEGKMKPEEVRNYTDIVEKATQQTVVFLAELGGTEHGKGNENSTLHQE